MKPGRELVPLAAVLRTEELERRPLRAPDYEAESRALAALAGALADGPQTILQAMAEIMLRTFRADSAGFSLLSADGKQFQWRAIAGVWRSHLGGSTPRDFGPCGDVLDRGTPLLFVHPEQRYTYLASVVPTMAECLLVPFHVRGKAVGTIWIAHHDTPPNPERQRFDAEDLRLMLSLARYASVAYQATALLREAGERDAALRQSQSELKQRATELQQASALAPARRAALNLMEDAVQARKALEQTNRELRESEQRLERELAAARQLQSVSALLIEGGDTGALYQKIVEAACAVMRADGASMQAFDESEGVLRLLAFGGFDPAFGVIYARGAIDARTCCSLAWRAGERVVVPDVESWDLVSATAELEDFRSAGIRAVQSTPLRSRTGRVLGMLSTHWRTPHTPAQGDWISLDVLARQAADLIERQRGDELMRQSEALLSKVVEYAPSGTYVVDSRFRVRQVNARALPLFDAVEPLLGGDVAQALEIIWGPHVGGEVARILRRALETGEGHVSREFWARRCDLGADECYEWEVQRLTLPGGDHALVCHFTDVTERRRAEGELRQSEVRLRFMAESMPQKIFTAEASGEYDYLNRQWLDYAGLPLEELTGWGWTRLIHPDDLDETLRAWQHCLESGEPFELEHRCRHAGGQHRWHLTRARAFCDGQGNVSMWIGSSTDVHEAKEGERRKDEFLATLAHELRNPLAPVVHAAQLLRQAKLAEPGPARAVELIARQSERMARLLDDLLDVSRITRGMVELRRERLDLRLAIEAAVEASEVQMREKRQEFERSPLREPIWLDADPVRIEQVLINLLSNAAKYTPPGGRIELAVTEELGWVVLQVRDTGIGISAQMLPRVFELFSQERTGKTTEGLGIGLTVVRQLVELHGGSVSAQSAGRGRGSAFFVSLPTLEADSVAQPMPVRPTAPAAPAGPTPPRRILIVEDHADAAEALGAILEGWGHEVSTVASGPAALDAAPALHPDIILLDIGLPGMSGYEVAEQLRRLPALADARIIAMTGYGQDRDRERSRAAGFDEHLVKPVRVPALEALLARTGRK